MRESVAILDVIAPFVELPAGDRRVFYTYCPIHKGDSSTAFKVDVEGNSWFCFRCDKGGSVLDFVIAMTGCSLREAAELLADGQELRKPDSMQRLVRTTGGRLKSWQARNEEPPPLGDDGVPEVTVLDSCRGLSRASIDRYGLRRTVLSEGWGSGLFIPFRDHHGIRIGYALRHPDGIKPKYLNSKGMARGSTLYGFWEGREAITQKDCAILVEGQMDCISLSDRGFENVCALMGTQFTQKQAQILLPHCHKIILMLDGDEEGRKAAKDIHKDWKSVFDIKVVDIDGDPDEVPVEQLMKLLGE